MACRGRHSENRHNVLLCCLKSAALCLSFPKGMRYLLILRSFYLHFDNHLRNECDLYYGVRSWEMQLPLHGTCLQSLQWCWTLPPLYWLSAVVFRPIYSCCIISPVISCAFLSTNYTLGEQFVPDGYYVETCWIFRHGVAPKDDVAGKCVVALPCHQHDLLLPLLPTPEVHSCWKGRECPMASW